MQYESECVSKSINTQICWDSLKAIICEKGINTNTEGQGKIHN